MGLSCEGWGVGVRANEDIQGPESRVSSSWISLTPLVFTNTGSGIEENLEATHLNMESSP